MSDHDLDPDLSDVFRSLYGGEDWAFDDDEPSEALVPDVEVVERDLELTDQRYTREYFRSNLDSLLDHRTGSTSRIYPAVRTFNTIVSSTEPIPSGPSGCYAPYSHLSLLNRLQTYTTSTFSTHPPPLSPVTLALHGWRNDGRETLTCDACQGSWNLLALEEIRDGNVRAEVARRLGKGLQTRHLPSCPWRAKRTPDDVYATIRTSLHPLALQSLAALVNSLEPNVPPGLRYISPLSPTQVSTLATRLAKDAANAEIVSVLAFFAWYPYSPTESIIARTTTTDVLCCRLCRRRVGLWQYADGNVFDVRDEHLGWCPIRADDWWSNSELLKEKKRTWDTAWEKDWVKVSDQLVERPWRKRRK